MADQRMVYVSTRTHQRLKLLAAHRNRTMGEIVSDLVDHEVADAAQLWTGPEGLMLQQSMLAKVWDDPALCVYDED